MILLFTSRRNSFVHWKFVILRFFFFSSTSWWDLNSFKCHKRMYCRNEPQWLSLSPNFRNSWVDDTLSLKQRQQEILLYILLESMECECSCDQRMWVYPFLIWRFFFHLVFSFSFFQDWDKDENSTLDVRTLTSVQPHTLHSVFPHTRSSQPRWGGILTQPCVLVTVGTNTNPTALLLPLWPDSHLLCPHRAILRCGLSVLSRPPSVCGSISSKTQTNLRGRATTAQEHRNQVFKITEPSFNCTQMMLFSKGWLHCVD